MPTEIRRSPFNVSKASMPKKVKLTIAAVIIFFGALHVIGGGLVHHHASAASPPTTMPDGRGD